MQIRQQKDKKKYYNKTKHKHTEPWSSFSFRNYCNEDFCKEVWRRPKQVKILHTIVGQLSATETSARANLVFKFSKSS